MGRTSNVISNIIPNVGALAVEDVIPPPGVGWLVTDFSNDHPFIGTILCPDLEVSLTDGLGTAGIVLLDPALDLTGRRTRQLKLYVTNALYFTITNTSAIGANLGYFGERVPAGNIRSGHFTVGVGAQVAFGAPPNETWCITEYGASAWTVLPALDINPNCDLGLTTAAGGLVDNRITQSLQARAQDKQPNIIIDELLLLTVFSTPGIEFYFSAIRIPEGSIGSIADVDGTGGVNFVDIRPPDGEEWVITEIGAELWAGAGFPADLPDVIVALRTDAGPDESTIMEDGALLSARWNTDAILKINHNIYLRITDNSGAFNEVCVSGYLQRVYL